MFWFASIACGLSFIGALFFVPEVSGHTSRLPSSSRSPTHRVQTTYHRQPSAFKAKPESGASEDNLSVEKTRMPTEDRHFGPNARSQERATFTLSQLKVYNGTFSNESLWTLFLQQFPLILSPVVRDFRRQLVVARASTYSPPR